MTDTRPADIADTDVYITRAFNAPRALVWRFWTEPELLARWFGPEGFHTPVEKISVDLSPGGHWNLVMVDDATGDEYPIRSTVLEVLAPEYFIALEEADTSAGFLRDIRIHVQFHDHGEKTRVTLHQGPFTLEQREQTEQGWEMSFVKLDTIFAEESA